MVGNANANGVPFIKNGTSFLKDNIVLWYDIKRQGATNESMSQNPILKDLSGNGHDATCYNFAWNRQSGISSYIDFNLFKRNNWENYVKDVTEISFIYYRPGNDISVMINTNNYVVYPFQIKVTGITNTGLRLEYGQGTIPETESSIKTDGVYTITRTAYGGFKLYGDESITCNIKIEQIAYPNALVADGVDDYVRVDGLPILTDYTVIAKRKWIKTEYDTYATFSSKSNSTTNGEFIFERLSLNGDPQVYSFGGMTYIGTFAENITYQTPTSYNGKVINKGDLLGNDRLSLFALRGLIQYSNIALYSFILFDRTLTDEEIKKWIRENMDENYLLPNERPEPIIYYDFRNGDNSNLNTVTDLSGNERHGTMYNFTGEANSGYSGGCLKFNGIDNYIEIPYSSDAVYKTVIMLLRIPGTGDGIVYEGRHYNPSTGGIALYYNKDSSPYLRGRLPEDAIVYINGVPNTIYTNIDMTQKKNCAAVTLDVFLSGDATYSPRIGTARGSTTYSVPIDLYAFLGFDKILTEEEIRYVMNKYNLLEGIDEI